MHIDICPILGLQCMSSGVWIKTISNAHSFWWSTLETLIWPKIVTKVVKCVKSWNMIGCVIFTCHMFSSYCVLANWLFIYCGLPSFCIVWKLLFVSCPGDKLVVLDLTTSLCEHCWWFPLWVLRRKMLVIGKVCHICNQCWRPSQYKDVVLSV